jgi:uncharacterized protein with von Willebrand factor type A (vWA) domain
MSAAIGRGPSAAGSAGTLAANVVGFARLLRDAGFSVGPGRTLDAVRAVESVGIERRDDVYWALHAVLVSGPDERELFRQAFALFWRDPTEPPESLADLLPTVDELRRRRSRSVSRRLAEARRRGPTSAAPESGQRRQALDVVMAWSDQETIRTRDFEDMSSEELPTRRLRWTRRCQGHPARRPALGPGPDSAPVASSRTANASAGRPL